MMKKQPYFEPTHQTVCGTMVSQGSEATRPFVSVAEIVQNTIDQFDAGGYIQISRPGQIKMLRVASELVLLGERLARAFNDPLIEYIDDDEAE